MRRHQQERDDQEAAKERDCAENHLAKYLVRSNGGSRYAISRIFVY
jgi:hypothetical protein